MDLSLVRDIQTRTRIPFLGSERPTIGVEVEIQIIDPHSWDLKQASVSLLERLDSPRIKQELTQSTIEINTGICQQVAEATEDLRNSMQLLYKVGEELDCTFAAAGTHPFANWRDQLIYPNERYQMLVERIQWPARRLLIYGLHVHVGISSGEKAIAIGNAMTNFLPHLLALSASSPFTEYRDTGLASTRTKIFEAMPTAGLPYRLANYGEFQAFMNALIRAGAIQSIREIWWDIRPHTNFGTLEVRICDALSTLQETAAMVALIQSLIVWLDDLYTSGIFVDLLRPWIVRENKWRAARYGLDASIIVNNRGDQAPITEEIIRLLHILHPVSQRLHCEKELQDIELILQNGASYQRQRKVYEQAGKYTDVVQHLVKELRDDVYSG